MGEEDHKVAKEPVLTWDRDRVVATIPKIVEAWRNRASWLGDMKSPEVSFRPLSIVEGSRRHALYLYLSAWLSRSGKTANQVIRSAGEIASNPELVRIFDPSRTGAQLTLRDLDVLYEAVPFVRTNHPLVQGWYGNLRILRNHYGSDPRRIFHGLGIDPHDHGSILAAREMLISRMCQFYGIAHKIAQLFIPWMQQVRWREGKDEWGKARLVPAVAVDIWFMRTAYQFGWIKEWKSDHRDRIAREISDYMSRICLEYGYDWHDFAQGMWHIGARMCSTCRKKSSEEEARVHCYRNCPAFSWCSSMVPANRDNKGRGSVRFDLSQVHPVGITDVTMHLDLRWGGDKEP